ncbi:PLP-dependent aminotransferase family protein [Paenibacillus methanolicus]|uniref:GntR family transcriptional regulator/MocR family aminotransferase n=1 Tax=Paenibacillus methanolicus TaxID=582686 RepID=A0A5S5BTG2_9BACL|nr:PLP-dependent aminotransferase family protein [Paenibacillus methanolicus]TYP69492.1 GntR family transcriptional regulator/MocR family aminotransferase [Paenibacillus methanolicus]
MLMPPLLDTKDSKPVYLSIYRFYREHILLGLLPHDAKLPSIRALAQHLGISRNPVETAYDHLVSEGYIANKPKSGYTVAPVMPILGANETDDSSRQQLGPASPASDNRTPAIADAAANDAPLSTREPAPHDAHPDAAPSLDFAPIDFAYDAVRQEDFPLRIWTRLTTRAMREAGSALFGYGDARGELRLRRLIQSYVRQNRGVRCDPEQIIVTAGTQQAAILIAQLLEGDTRPLGVEAAMHPGLYRVFARQRLRPQPIPLDSDGISCDALERNGELCGVYLTPSHQFPYGGILPAAKRLRLLQWASSQEAWLIEDDYDSEYVYDGRPLPSLQGMDRFGRVIYMGTFSKALVPSLRLSYVVLPPFLLDRYERDFADVDPTVSRLTQLTMAAFMEDGHMERHTRRMKQCYIASRRTLLASVERHFQGKAAVTGSGSGLHLLLAYENGLPITELLEQSRRARIGLRPVSDFHAQAIGGGSPSSFDPFVLGYGGLTEAEIEEGIWRLGRAWRNDE